MSSQGQLSSPEEIALATFLRYQINVASHLCEPGFDFLDDDLDSLVHLVISNMARGQTQKQIHKVFAPWLDTPQQRDVFLHLCSWAFATKGVLATQYHPLSAASATASATTYASPTRHARIVCQNSSLLLLPSELLDMVLENLPVQDTNDLRLTCRQAQMRTFPFWSKTCFRSRQFMVDEYSLQTLVDISLHPQLSRALTHLVIGVDEIDAKDTLTHMMDDYASNPANVPTLFQYWRDAVSSQQALLNSGRAVDMLSSAISHLPNLDAVSVTGSRVSRISPWYSNIVQYPDLGMRSYGSSAYSMQKRYTRDGMPNSQGFVDRVFNIVLSSLARSKPSIASLRTRLSRGDEILEHLGDEAFNLPRFAAMHTSAATMLSGLSELHLDINLESSLLHSVDNLIDHKHAFGPCNVGLRQFLASARNLQCLTLDVWGGATSEGHCDFMAWLCEPAGLPENLETGGTNIDMEPNTSTVWTPPPIALPSLRRLVLKGFYMSPNQLRAIFKKFDGLKSVALLGVYLRRCLIDGPPVPESSDEMDNLWADFFRRSSSILSKLDSLELENLAVMQYREDSEVGVSVTQKDMELIVFVPSDRSTEPPSNFSNVTDFSKAALKKLADETWLGRDWTPTPDQTEMDD